MTNSTLEKVARVLEPQAWAALGTGDTLAYKNRRTSSLRKARKVLNALRQVDDETVEAMATDHGWRGLNRTRDTANLAGRGFKSIVQAILTEGGET